MNGFRADPLHTVFIDTARAPTKTEPFDLKKHSEQLNAEGVDITVMPFSVAPLNLLAKIAAAPRVIRDKISFSGLASRLLRGNEADGLFHRSFHSRARDARLLPAVPSRLARRV